MYTPTLFYFLKAIVWEENKPSIAKKLKQVNTKEYS
jgi:hypothetical protein